MTLPACTLTRSVPRTRRVTGTRLLLVQFTWTPGLYPGPGLYTGPGYYPRFYGNMKLQHGSAHLACTVQPACNYERSTLLAWWVWDFCLKTSPTCATAFRQKCCAYDTGLACCGKLVCQILSFLLWSFKLHYHTTDTDTLILMILWRFLSMNYIYGAFCALGLWRLMIFNVRTTWFVTGNCVPNLNFLQPFHSWDRQA